MSRPHLDTARSGEIYPILDFEILFGLTAADIAKAKEEGILAVKKIGNKEFVLVDDLIDRMKSISDV